MLISFYEKQSGYKFLCEGLGGIGWWTLGGKCQRTRLPDHTVKVDLFWKLLPCCPQCDYILTSALHSRGKTPALHILTALDASGALDFHHLPSQETCYDIAAIICHFLLIYVEENFVIFLLSICKSWVFYSEFPLFNGIVPYPIIERLKFLTVLSGHVPG